MHLAALPPNDMLPKTLALVEDDPDFSEFLSQYLQGRGILVKAFGDSSDLLVEAGAFEFDFYVLDLGLPGIDGVDMLKLLRRRTQAGILVVSGRVASDVFSQVITAGADMLLTKPVQFEQVALAIEAVQRRVASASPGLAPWKLDRRARQLVAPDGVHVDLSEGDLAVVECFVNAGGDAVTREALCERLGLPPDGDNLNATIYRLRRRIERATPAVVPLQSKSRVGYVFRAPLLAV